MTQGPGEEQATTGSEEDNNGIEDIENFAPSNVPPASSPDIALSREKPREYKPSGIDKLRESTRGGLAFLLFLIYGILMGYILFLVHKEKIAEGERKELLTLLVTSQSALMGSALGFYFGGKRESGN